MAFLVDELQPGGRVVYTERAFEQDSQQAMRGDIVRGLIELITNADDSYARLGSDNGKIRVEVEHRRTSSWKVIVRDRAEGLTLDDLVNKVVNIAERTSGFEKGQAVRGNLGRGAKDLTAFGPVTYESIKDGKYAAIRLNVDGSYDRLGKTRVASAEDRARLGIPKNGGTVVTVEVRDSVKCPNHSTLKKRLSLHYQLRDILSDPSRDVVLLNLNSDEEDSLTYQVTAGEVLGSWTLEVPGYENARARLSVYRLSERCEDSASDPGRPGGILVKGRRAIYENTLFGFEQNPNAAFLAGRLECPFIDELAFEYDDRAI